MKAGQFAVEVGRLMTIASLTLAFSAHASKSETMEEAIDRQLTEGFKELGEEILSDAKDRARENAVNESVAEDSLGLLDLLRECSIEFVEGSHLKNLLVERATELKETGFTDDQSILVADTEFGRGFVLLSIEEAKPICESIRLRNLASEG